MNGQCFKPADHHVKNEQEIYEKNDGYYYTYDTKKRIFTMYERSLSRGYIYNSVIVSKIFMLTYLEGPKVIPQLNKKTTSKFEDFDSELKASIQAYRDRTFVATQVERLNLNVKDLA
jgi:hypothetical protein